MDSVSAHKADSVKDQLKDLNTHIAIIPGGLTKILQPLDLTVNRVFKSKVRERWERWMSEGLHSFTKTGRMRKATYADVANWVKDAWDAVDAGIIQRAFLEAKLVPENIKCADSDTSDDDIPFARLTRSSNLELFHSLSENYDFGGWLKMEN